MRMIISAETVRVGDRVSTSHGVGRVREVRANAKGVTLFLRALTTEVERLHSGAQETKVEYLRGFDGAVPLLCVERPTATAEGQARHAHALLYRVAEECAEAAAYGAEDGEGAVAASEASRQAQAALAAARALVLALGGDDPGGW